MESVRSKFSVLAIALLLVFSTTLAFGQGIVTGTISGTVVDQQGAVVSGATVTAKDASTNREFTMGAQALAIGAEGEVVDVEGTAPLVEATTAQVSSSFEGSKVTSIPVAGGNGFDALALLVPGAASAGDAGFSNTNGADVAVN